MNVLFNDASVYQKGLIESLLLSAYQDIPTTTQEDKESFTAFDSELHDHPRWLGKYVFITSVDGIPTGFVSFDPRQKPIAVIGHNCVSPDYKGRELGKKQLLHALAEIKNQGFSKVVVSTCTNDYFIPAQKMYVSCGFIETRKFYKEDTDIEMVEFEINL